MPEVAFDTYIFDLDGTVLDTLPDLVVLTNKALEDCGFPQHTSDEILSYVGNGARALMQQAVPQDVDAAAVDAAVARWKALYPEYGYSLTRPYSGLPELFASMKERGLRIAVLSNKFDAATKEVIGRYYPGVFDVVHGECAAIPRKPDPTGLLRTIEELGSNPSTAAYVGDSPGDMLVAHNAGVFPLGVSWGYRSRPDLESADAGFVADTRSELAEFIAAHSL